MSEIGAIERRPLAGTRIVTSVLGLEIDPLPTARLEEDEVSAAWIRRSLDWGITAFDLSRARSVPRAVRLLRTALTGKDAPVVLIVGFSRASARPGPAALVTGPVRRPSFGVPDTEERLLETVRAVRPAGSVLVDWDPGDSPSWPTDPIARWLDERTEEGTIAGWSLHLGSLPRSSDEEPPGAWKSPVSVELSLLHHDPIDSLNGQFAQRPGSVLVRDPFASGRLDGSRISRANEWPTPSVRPINLASLHAEFDAVLELAPLTRGRRRTLAQASIQYLLRWPWVSTVILPFVSVQRWDELGGAFSAPPLELSELEALGLLTRSGDLRRDKRGPPA